MSDEADLLIPLQTDLLCREEGMLIICIWDMRNESNFCIILENENSNTEETGWTLTVQKFGAILPQPVQIINCICEKSGNLFDNNI